MWLLCYVSVLPVLLYVLWDLSALIEVPAAIFKAERCSTPDRSDRSGETEFDFVIVGSSPGGSAVAYRLTENAQIRVLLLEAGGEEVPIMRVPGFMSLFQGTDVNWHYVTTPQNTSCMSMVDSRCDYPMGRALGGATAINYMFNIRGNGKDFDHWEEMGNDGWNYEEVLPYFRKVEDVEIPELQNSDYRGYGGRIKTTFPVYYSDAAKLILRSANEAGFATPEDYNGAIQTGASRIQTTTFNGERWSANPGYLNTARERPNLFLRYNSFVTRIVLEEGRARGVRYIRNGQEEVAYATREVILSAGAVHSPALLMRSGIGPEDHLAELNIPLEKNLPVGHNLMDHTGLVATFTTFNQSVTPSLMERLLNPFTYTDYFLSRKGPLTSTGVFEVLSFHDLEGTPYHTPNWPPVEILYISLNLISSQRIADIFRVSEETYDTVLRPYENDPMFFGCIWATRPKSRGRIYLLDEDPFTPPQIDPRGLSDPEDVEVVLAGLRDFQKIVAAPSMQEVGARMVDIPPPGCESETYDTDEYWRCAIRHLSLTIYHQCGTCKMGPSGDPTAVVTPDLKVVGIAGLRVVDASIMPQVVSGHLQMTSYMIGEKISDVIKAEYGI